MNKDEKQYTDKKNKAMNEDEEIKIWHMSLVWSEMLHTTPGDSSSPRARQKPAVMPTFREHT